MPGTKILLMGDPLVPSQLMWLVDQTGEDAYRVQRAGPPARGRLRADFWGPITSFLIDSFDAGPGHIVLRKEGIVIGIERPPEPSDEVVWTLNGIKMLPDRTAPLDMVPAELVGLELSGFTTWDGAPCRYLSLCLGARSETGAYSWP